MDINAEHAGVPRHSRAGGGLAERWGSRLSRGIGGRAVANGDARVEQRGAHRGDVRERRVDCFGDDGWREIYAA